MLLWLVDYSDRSTERMLESWELERLASEYWSIFVIFYISFIWLTKIELLLYIRILCSIVTGFGANLLAYDVFESDVVKNLGGKYVSKEEMYKTCDVIFLMMPLLPATKHTINAEMLPLLKKGVLIINTSRGGLIDSTALISGIQSGIIGGAGIDVYENEGDYFFQDWSAKNIDDPTLVSLLGNNKVVMTAHQAFFTREAIEKIVSTTILNIQEFSEGLRGKDLTNSV